jgi:hypothetical protein
MRKLFAIVWIGIVGGGALALALFSDKLVKSTSADTLSYYRSPDFFPNLSLYVIAFLSAAFCIRLCTGYTVKIDEIQGVQIRPPRILGLFITFLLYGILIKWIGYFFSSLIFFIIGLSLGNISKRTKIGIALTMAVILSIIFNYLLDVWFPEPLLLEMFYE